MLKSPNVVSEKTTPPDSLRLCQEKPELLLGEARPMKILKWLMFCAGLVVQGNNTLYTTTIVEHLCLGQLLVSMLETYSM